MQVLFSASIIGLRAEQNKIMFIFHEIFVICLNSLDAFHGTDLLMQLGDWLLPLTTVNSISARWPSVCAHTNTGGVAAMQPSDWLLPPCYNRMRV